MLLALFNDVCGQDVTATINGIITDNFGALPGAKVNIMGSDVSTHTDVNGHYTLIVPTGPQKIQVSFVMYESQVRNINLNSGDSLQVDLQLSTGFSVDQQISVGSRAQPKSLLETSVPVDIISPQEISNSAQIELGQILHYLAPSFHSTHQTISDGTDHIDPATLRGLGPDQVLVLINGKRRHSSSLLNVNGTLGRGTVGTDFNAIPVTAVDRIEILRDGAAALYGSDAIAGVINIILKEKTGSIDIDTRLGRNTEGDGQTTFTGANVGLPLSKTGFINLSAEYRERDPTNRAGNYTGQIYPSGSGFTDADFLARAPYGNGRVMEIGNAAAKNTALFINMRYPLYTNVALYAHGGKNFRQGTSHAFYRFPKDQNRVVTMLYPHGFSPEIFTDIADDALTLGVQSSLGEWDIDFSNTLGKNAMDFQIKNSNNASLGQESPNVFYAGGFEYGQNNTNLDINRQFDVLSGLNLAFGLEFRVDEYSILAGDEDSWIDGGSFIIQGIDTIAGAAGSQGFPGFQPENELNRIRTNNAGYVDIESHLTDKFLVGAAARIESYSDFGDQTTWKLSLRYQLKEWLSIRGGYSTGFRAPSLHQVYFNNVSTQFAGGTAFQVGTFNNESPVTKAFNIQALKPELSKHFSSGVSMRIQSFLSLIFDFYDILIDDRIVLSGRFDVGYENILAPLGVSAAQFFTNAIDTETRGIDAAVVYQNKEILPGELTASLAFNVSETSLRGGIKVPDALAGVEETLFNREEISRAESDVQPQAKLTSLLTYEVGKIRIETRNTYLGEVKYIHPSDISRDQAFSAKTVTDFSVSYQFNNNLNGKIGGHNVFDIYPDKLTDPANIGDGNFVYSRRAQQFGVKGAYYFLGISLSL